MRALVSWALAALLLAPACRPLPTSPCLAPDPEQPDVFRRCRSGSGAFGQWMVDEQGLPAYRYTLDQRQDPRAEWTLSTGEVRRDHRFQVGNDRLHAFATNDGYVELFTRERGPVLWNRIALDQERTGGGYSYVAEDDRVWASAWALAPAGAHSRRQFGIGYARYDTRWGDVEVRHQILAPVGDVPYLVDEVTLVNHGSRTRTLRHYEFWDVNRHPLILQLARSGSLTPSLPIEGDRIRDAQNQLFRLDALPTADGAGVRIRHTYDSTHLAAEDEVSDRDEYPWDLFLTRLLPPVTQVPLQIHTDRAAFLGTGGVTRPDVVVEGSAPAPLFSAESGEGEPAVLVDEVGLTLGPGESRRLRYAIGVVPPSDSLETTAPFQAPDLDPRASLANRWRARLPYAVVPGAPALHREMAWHAAMLQSAAVWDDYFEAHTIVQGSVYLYGHGLDGAGRDFALFSVPAAYLDPALARGCLRTMMRMTYADTRQVSYAVQGHGVLETAGIHSAPSDIDLFFLWAVLEYVSATGDRAFLEDVSPYWPKRAALRDTTLAHVRSQIRHLLDDVGLGEHGLVRLGTGDWSDGITMEASDRERAEREGESVPNTQMAAWVLPRIAAWFDEDDPGFAQEIRDWAAARRTAAAAEWVEAWYRRAWFGGGETYGEGHLNLEAQIWALIADIPEGDRLTTLLDVIDEKLESTSEVGARRVPGGMVWHAITGLLTWGYARHDPARAWRALRRHTLRAYAEANPDQWYGIWSGADGMGVHGGTWTSVVTPMTDFPVFNANQHAMPLVGLLRVAGLAPAPMGDGLTVAPIRPERVAGQPGAPVTLDLPLLRLTWDERSVAGTYRALVESHTALYVRVPAGASTATVNDEPVVLPAAGAPLRIPVDLFEGQRLTFRVE